MIRESIEAFAEPFQINGDAYAFFRCLEDDEGSCLAGTQCLEEIILKDYLSIAAVFEAADEIGATDILAVDIETKTVGQ